MSHPFVLEPEFSYVSFLQSFFYFNVLFNWLKCRIQLVAVTRGLYMWLHL